MLSSASTPNSELTKKLKELLSKSNQCDLNSFKSEAMQLVRDGADPSVQGGSFWCKGTLLHYLVSKNEKNVNDGEITELLNLNENLVNVKSGDDITPLQALINKRINFNPDDFRATAMLLARRGADLTVKGKDEYTLLHCLMEESGEYGSHLDAIEELLNLNNKLVNVTSRDVWTPLGCTPLQYLMNNLLNHNYFHFYRFKDIAMLLARRGADLTVRNKDGKTLLQHLELTNKNDSNKSEIDELKREELRRYELRREEWKREELRREKLSKVSKLDPSTEEVIKDIRQILKDENETPSSGQVTEVNSSISKQVTEKTAHVNHDSKILNRALGKLNSLKLANEANTKMVISLAQSLRWFSDSPYNDIDACLEINFKSMQHIFTAEKIAAMAWQGAGDLKALSADIDEMFAYGLYLMYEENASQPMKENILNLAMELKQDLKNFSDQRKPNNSQQLEQFKAQFNKKLNTGEQIIGDHRDYWKVILANIAISLTVVGLLALAAYNAYTFYQDRSLHCFFEKTHRQKLRDTIKTDTQELRYRGQV